MKNRLINYIAVSLSLALMVLHACSSPQPVSPANFEVQSLKVSPQQVATGVDVTVTAEVANTGGLPGNFSEPVLVNDKVAASKEVTIQPGSSKVLTYTVSQNSSGKYTVKLDGLSAALLVTGTVERDVELKYDNGQCKGALWAGNNGGFLVCFDPPDKPFALKKVSICGGIYGTAWEGKSFELSILDSDMKSVVCHDSYVIAKFPVRGAFPYQPPLWVDFNLPMTTFENKFYVYLYTGMGKHHGVHIGVDNSAVNENSYLAQGKPPYIAIVEPTTQYPATIWYSDITKLNWMIRASGTAMVPE
jgi:hypothetical protein